MGPGRKSVGITVLAVATAITGLASPTHAEPLTEDAAKLIDGRLFRARLMSNPKAALEYCREAEAIAAKYDRNPYCDGIIADCLAHAHVHLKEKEPACHQQARALERLQAVPADHPGHAEAAELISEIRRDQPRFGCREGASGGGADDR